jgi:hypothetical protein
MARRTHCPQGRQLFRVGEIPAELATVTQLRLLRRRPAAGQTPVATLLYHGNKYTDLWQVAATEPMPDLSPSRRARYEAVRTCLRCGLRRERPWKPAPETDRRVCPPCAEAEAEASWWRARNLARAGAVAWAVEVLADPAVVLFHEQSVAILTLGVRVVDVAGAVLLDATVRHNERDGLGPCPAGAVSIRDVANQVRALAGRRLIVWSEHRYGPHSLVWNMRTLLGEELDLAVNRPADPWGPSDELGVRYAEWLGVRDGSGSWRYDRRILYPPLPPAQATPPDPAAAVTRMRELLGLMAVDDHPAGPPTCHGLLPGGRTVCGASGALAVGAIRSHGVCRECLNREVSRG